MRVCLDLTPAVHGRAGIGRYAGELAAALLRIAPEHAYSGLFDLGGPGQRLPVELGPVAPWPIGMNAKAWRMTCLLATLAGVGLDRRLPPCDVFHATDHLLPPATRSASVVTVLDLTFRILPQYHLPLNRWYQNLALPVFLKRAGAVIAISESTRRDLETWVSLPWTEVKVVHLGVSPVFGPVRDQERLEEVRRRYQLPERYILYLGTLEPRKNLAALVDAYAALSGRTGGVPPLVLAGKRGWLSDDLFAQIERRGLSGRVHCTGWVEEHDVPAVLSGATVFVFPSWYEGFGLPVLEAMACGVPVVASNTSSLPEVAGDAAILVDPADPAALVAAMESILGDESLAVRLAARGLERAARFTWEKTARETLVVYERALALHRGNVGVA